LSASEREPSTRAELIQADLIAGVAGVVLVIAIFLPWFGPSEAAERALEEAREVTERFGGGPVQSPDLTENAWEAFTFVDWVLLVTALVGIRAGVASLARPGGRSTVGATAVTAGLGIISSLLVLYRVINPIGEASREYGLFIGFFAALGVAVGGWLALEEGTRSSGGAADSIGSRPHG
jgi:hypothetical protein